MNEKQGYILCVDDQPEVVDVLLMQLEAAVGDECQIEVAESASEALRVLRDIEADDDIVELVITDEIMPGLKGSRFLELIHEHDPDIMTMLLTGQAGLDDVIYAVNNGHLAKCLKKPWDTDELISTVRELLARTRLNRRNKQLDQQVAEEKNKAEAIVHSMTDGILVVDSAERVSLMNTACVDILGVPEQTLLGKRLLDVLHIKELILLHMAASRQVDHMVSDEIELPNPRDEHATLHIAAVAKTLRDKSGAPLGVVTVLRDITREQEVNAMKANFLATMSHELRTPLTSIISTFELLSQEALGPITQEQREFIATSQEQGKVLSEVIENLIDLSTLESGKLDLSLETVETPRVLREALNAFQDALQAKNLDWSLDIADDVPAIEADQPKLLRLFKLVLSNAVKFTEAGTIALAIAPAPPEADINGNLPEPGRVQVSIADTGIGMSSSQCSRAFEKFYQADNSITREFRGSGMGLAVCHAIVEAHHGTIWIESELHQGTTVYCHLPITQEPAESPASA